MCSYSFLHMQESRWDCGTAVNRTYHLNGYHIYYLYNLYDRKRSSLPEALKHRSEGMRVLGVGWLGVVIYFMPRMPGLNEVVEKIMPNNTTNP